MGGGDDYDDADDAGDAGDVDDSDAASASVPFQAGAKKRPPFSEMVTDVFDVVPDLLQEQYAELSAHMAKYPGVYDLDKGH